MNFEFGRPEVAPSVLLAGRSNPTTKFLLHNVALLCGEDNAVSGIDFRINFYFKCTDKRWAQRKGFSSVEENSKAQNVFAYTEGSLTKRPIN